MTGGLAAGLLGALAGGLAGALAHRYLRTRRYRYADESGLPERDTRWVLVVTPLAASQLEAIQAQNKALMETLRGKVGGNG